MKKLFFIISATFLPFSSYAWEPCGTDVLGNTANCEYQIINDTLTIRGTGDNGNIGFWDASGPASGAPWKSKTFENIVIENTIKDLGTYGFTNVRANQPLEIPSSVSMISYEAFHGSDISKIILPDTISKIETRGFSFTTLTQIDIPKSVQSIGYAAFRSAENLKSLVIPDSVTTVEDFAFSKMTALETLVISENVALGDIFAATDYDTAFTNTSNLKIYCTGDTSKCDANLAAAGYPDLKSSKASTKEINGVTYVYNNKGKLITTSGQRAEKRIYTIEEANRVAGDKNRVSIKYK